MLHRSGLCSFQFVNRGATKSDANHNLQLLADVKETGKVREKGMVRLDSLYGSFARGHTFVL